MLGRDATATLRTAASLLRDVVRRREGRAASSSLAACRAASWGTSWGQTAAGHSRRVDGHHQRPSNGCTGLCLPE
jgi:hypothetical protein